MSHGVIIAAPGSGSGKTTLTLALLRRLREAGVAVASAKVGPDYIDPAYHAAASGRTCHNLDTWSMSDRTLSALIADLQRDASAIVVEGVMGLFDGAPDGRRLGRRSLAAHRLAGGAGGRCFGHGGVGGRAGARLHELRSRGRGRGRHLQPHRQREARGTAAPRHAARGHPGLRLRHPQRTPGAAGSASRPGPRPREHPDLEGFLAGAAEQIGSEVDAGRPAGRGAASMHRTAGGRARPAGARPAYRGGARRRVRVLLPLCARCLAVCRVRVELFSRRSTTSRPARTRTPCISRVDTRSCMPPGWPTLGDSGAALRRCAERGAVIYGECGGYMVLGERLVGRRRRLAPDGGSAAGGNIVRVTAPEHWLPRGGAGGRRRVRTQGRALFAATSSTSRRLLSPSPGLGLVPDLQRGVGAAGGYGAAGRQRDGIVRAPDGSVQGPDSLKRHQLGT